MANEYEDAKVYLITVGDERYVGSTRLPMEMRMTQHRADSSTKHTMRRLYDAVDDAGGWDAVNVRVLEAYPCSSRTELELRERQWYDELRPELNMVRPARTDEEREAHNRQYYKEHADEIKKRVAAYKVENRDACLDRARRYREANPNKFKEWAADNKEAIRERKRAYREANAERIRARERELYAAKKAAATANKVRASWQTTVTSCRSPCC